MTYMSSEYPEPSPPQAPRGTSGTAIAGFVLAWLMPAVGLIVSLVAIGSTGRGRRAGRGLAIAGATLGGVFSMIWVLLIVGLAASGGSSDDTTLAVDPQGVVVEEAPVVAEPEPLPPPEPAPPAAPETATAETWRQIIVDPSAWSGGTIEFQADVLQYDTATGPETLLALAGPAGMDVWEVMDTVVLTGDPAMLTTLDLAEYPSVVAEVIGPYEYANTFGGGTVVPEFRLISVTPNP